MLPSINAWLLPSSWLLHPKLLRPVPPWLQTCTAVVSMKMQFREIKLETHEHDKSKTHKTHLQEHINVKINKPKFEKKNRNLKITRKCKNNLKRKWTNEYNIQKTNKHKTLNDAYVKKLSCKQLQISVPSGLLQLSHLLSPGNLSWPSHLSNLRFLNELKSSCDQLVLKKRTC